MSFKLEMVSILIVVAEFVDITAEFIFYSIFQGISQIYLIQDLYWYESLILIQLLNYFSLTSGIFIFCAILITNPFVGLSSLFGIYQSIFQSIYLTLLTIIL
jgi:hypothetical protein